MKPHKRGNPQEPDALAGEVQGGFDESGKLPDRLKRYAAASERRLLNVAQIDTTLHAMAVTPWRMHLESIRPKIAACGDYLGFKHYYTVGKVRLSAANFCKTHLLCPLCAIRRGSKSLEVYLERFAVIKADRPDLRLSMLTLTIKNGDDLAERYAHLRNALRKMMERRRKALAGARGWHSEFAKAEGLVGSIELTNKGNGWHPHAHLMVLHSDRFEYSALQAEWLKITGDSHVVNVSAAQHPDDPAQDFLEVFKYALKFSDLSPEQNLEAYGVLRGKHLLFSAGLFRGVEVPEDLTDAPLDELPYIELLYKFLPGVGYSLAETRDSEDLKPGPAEPVRTREYFRQSWSAFFGRQSSVSVERRDGRAQPASTDGPGELA
jgi:hypothetical protein